MYFDYFLKGIYTTGGELCIKFSNFITDIQRKKNFRIKSIYLRNSVFPSKTTLTTENQSIFSSTFSCRYTDTKQFQNT